MNTKLDNLLLQKVAVLDGSTFGAWQDLPLETWGDDPRLQYQLDHLNITRPDIPGNLGRDLVKAGSDAITTNTFGANRFVAAEVGVSAELLREWNRKGVAIAREAVAETPTLVLGGVGPGIDLVSFKRRSFDDFVSCYIEQIRSLWEAGVDGIYLQSFCDLGNAKAALQARRTLEDEFQAQIPVILTLSLTAGTMLSGETVEAIWSGLHDQRLSALGLSGGPFRSWEDEIRWLCDHAIVPTGVLLDAESIGVTPPFSYSGDWCAEQLEPLLQEPGLNFIGIGLFPNSERTNALSALAANAVPRVPKLRQASA